MSSPSTDFSVPPGYYPPFSIVTDTDHTAWIIIATSLGLCLVLLFAGLRVFVRCAISHGFGLDDTILFTATALAITQATLILGAGDAGLGRSVDLISDESLDRVQRLYYASDLLFTIALGLSKASVAVFLLRIAPMDPYRQCITIVVGFIIAWSVTALLVVALRCDVSQPWIFLGTKCTGLLLRWQVLEGLGCLFEASIFGIAVWLMWGLGSVRGADKVTVVVMFGFRLSVILFASLRLIFFDQTGISTDPTLLLAPFVCWTQIELNYSLISATVLVLRPFVSNLVTHYGGQGRHIGREDQDE